MNLCEFSHLENHSIRGPLDQHFYLDFPACQVTFSKKPWGIIRWQPGKAGLLGWEMPWGFQWNMVRKKSDEFLQGITDDFNKIVWIPWTFVKFSVWNAFKKGWESEAWPRWCMFRKLVLYSIGSFLSWLTVKWLYCNCIFLEVTHVDPCSMHQSILFWPALARTLRAPWSGSQAGILAFFLLRDNASWSTP